MRTASDLEKHMIGILICLLLILGDAALAWYFARELFRRESKGGWNR